MDRIPDGYRVLRDIGMHEMAVMTMNLEITNSVKIALRTFGDDERRRIQALFDTLKNWDHDEHLRKVSRSLPYKDTYELMASNGIRIFFNKNDQRILVIDIAKTKTIEQFVEAE